MHWRHGPNWHREAREVGFDPCVNWGLFTAPMRVTVAENQEWGICRTTEEDKMKLPFDAV